MDRLDLLAVGPTDLLAVGVGVESEDAIGLGRARSGVADRARAARPLAASASRATSAPPLAGPSRPEPAAAVVEPASTAGERVAGSRTEPAGLGLGPAVLSGPAAHDLFA